MAGLVDDGADAATTAAAVRVLADQARDAVGRGLHGGGLDVGRVGVAVLVDEQEMVVGE